MNAEQQLITTFYSNFQKGDWQAMIACYHKEVFFYDPVFLSLEGVKVGAMWEMLLTSAKDLEVSYDRVEGADGYGSCEWTATYTFSPTGRKVNNKVRAHFFISDGKIAEHHDDFSLWKWSAQALGMKGLLLGWTSTLHQRVHQQARSSLEKFIAAHKS